MSLKNRISLASFFLVFVVAVVVQLLIQERFLQSFLLDKEAATFRSFDQEISELGEVVVGGEENLLDASAQPYLLNAIRAYEQEKDYKVEGELRAYLADMIQDNPLYMSVALIDNDGNEKLKFERDGPWGMAHMLSQKDLMSIEETPLFENLSKAARGKIFISEINLKKEGQSLKLPPTPVASLGIPLFQGQERLGVMAIDIFVGPSLNGLTKAGEKSEFFDLYLANSQGFFLAHPRESIAFAFETTGSKYGIFEAFPELGKHFGGKLSNIPEDQVISLGDTEKILIRKVNLGIKELEAVFPVIQISINDFTPVFESIHNMRVTGILLSLLFGALMALLAALVLRLFFKPLDLFLQKIEENKDSKGKETKKDPLPEEGPQELSRLAVAFNRLHLLIAAEKGKVLSAREDQKQSEKVAKSRGAFLSRMSHEIRTPLNGIVGFTNLLDKEVSKAKGFPAKTQTYVNQIKNASEVLLELVNSVLDLSKFESGVMGVSVEEVDLRNVVDRCFDTARGSSEEKGVKLELSYSEKLAPYYKTDQSKLTQVITNLLGNAIRFTPAEKKVELRVSPLRGGIWIEVEDEGIGIDKEHHEQIFDAFRQGNDKTQVKYGGTGLGLSIVKHIVSQFGGEISLKSAPGEGSTFSIYIPMKKATSGPRKKEEDAHLEFKPGQKVLVVEDNPINQAITKETLESLNLSGVSIAVDGEEGLRKVKKTRYDLILMDYHMPGMSGIETTRSMKSYWDENNFDHCPIVMLTADVTNETKEGGMDAGIDDYITKPVDSAKLFSSLSNFLETVTKQEEEEEEESLPLLTKKLVKACLNTLKEIEEIPPHLGYEAIDLLDQLRETIRGYQFEEKETLDQLEKALGKGKEKAAKALLERLKNSIKTMSQNEGEGE